MWCYRYIICKQGLKIPNSLKCKFDEEIGVTHTHTHTHKVRMKHNRYRFSCPLLRDSKIKPYLLWPPHLHFPEKVIPLNIHNPPRHVPWWAGILYKRTGTCPISAEGTCSGSTGRTFLRKRQDHQFAKHYLFFFFLSANQLKYEQYSTGNNFITY